MDMEKMITAYPAMTDIHVTEGEQVSIRVYGSLKKLKEKGEDSFSPLSFMISWTQKRKRSGPAAAPATADAP